MGWTYVYVLIVKFITNDNDITNFCIWLDSWVASFVELQNFMWVVCIRVIL